MRKLKLHQRPLNNYRVWDKVDGCWIFNLNAEIFKENGGFRLLTLNNQTEYIVQMSTGFKDKNGKEIFEGDIVRYDLNHATVALGPKYMRGYTNGIVVWLNTAFKICQSYVGATYMNDFIACDCCPCGLEVIGNICEHPELVIEPKENELSV